MKKRLILFASSVILIIAISLWQKERIPTVLAQADSWLNSNGNMYSNVSATGRVGIGINPPGSYSGDYGPMLHVKGATGSTDTIWSGRVIASGPTSAVVMGELFNNHKAVIGGHNAALSAWAPLLINPNGSPVGIGTTDPGTSKLRVAGETYSNSLKLSDAGVSLFLDSASPTIKIGNGTSPFDGGQIEWRTQISRHWNIDQYQNQLRFYSEDNNNANGQLSVSFEQNGTINLGEGGSKIKGETNGDICIGNCN